MRLLADENFPGDVIRTLRKLGHDVLSAKEAAAGASDTLVLERAIAESRIVLTLDKDFGELAYRKLEPSECGVILIRLFGNSPKADNDRIVSVIERHTEWAGKFSVVTHDRIRVRPLPPKPTRNPLGQGDS